MAERMWRHAMNVVPGCGVEPVQVFFGDKPFTAPPKLWENFEHVYRSRLRELRGAGR